MKHLFFLFLAISTSLIAFSQKKTFTVKDTEIGIRRELAPMTMQNLQWRGSSDNFTYHDRLNIMQQSATEGVPKSLLNISELNQILKKGNLDTLPSLPSITWGNDSEFYFSASINWYFIDITLKKINAIIKTPENASNPSLYYPKKLLAFTIDNNLYLTGTDNKPLQITHDSDKDIVNGESVSRNEFGINLGIIWSPRGNSIAFYRKDNRNVGDYPLVDITTREAELNNIKYPMAGMPSEHVSVGIYNVGSGKTTFIEKQDTVSEKYLTNISWDPGENHVYIQVLNRNQNHMLFNKYNALEGSLVKTLFEERNEKYVEPLNAIQFLNKNKNWFIHQSRRDGFNHAYIYDTEGKLIKQLTSGNWEIISILGIDKLDNVYYLSTEGNPLEENGFKINAVTSKKLALSIEKGTHRIVPSQNFKYYIDDYSSITVPHIINLNSENGKLVRNILTAQNPLVNYNMPEMTIGTIKAGDGNTDLYYRIIKPIDFDATKKYPAIIYVYGGPHAQLINNQWLGGARLWDYMMAQKGYVVLTVDNRGSDNRGLAFENAIHRQCGVVEMQDQMAGVKLMKDLGYVDMNRVGVHGWSYGGFMTISLMVNNPGVFKAGVAGGPVIDWKYYEIMYGERYMDTPQENPEGYASTSLISKAKDLKGKLLIIHGGIDPTVVWQNSLVFINECIKNQVPVDYFVYPRAEHNVRGMDRVHLMSKITAYFEDNL